MDKENDVSFCNILEATVAGGSKWNYKVLDSILDLLVVRARYF